MKNKMKVNLDNEGLEPRENIIINMLTCRVEVRIGWLKIANNTCSFSPAASSD